MSQLAYSSVPAWARTPGRSTPTTTALPDTTGRSYVLVGVGDPHAPQSTSDDPSAVDLVRGWTQTLDPGVGRSVLLGDQVDTLAAQLRDTLRSSAVGVRVVLAGPVGSCLRLRATAIDAGLEDDEISVVPVGTGPVDVFCSHCRTTTHAVAAVDDVICCDGCDRDLLVYYHVSRRTGAFLGFMVDAETAPSGGATR